MNPVVASRRIAAPLDRVFQTVSDVRHFSKAVPDITHVEYLSDTRSGVGTRFIETRVMNGREGKVELEITEYEENDHVRLVSDAGGTIWDSLFAVRQVGSKVELSLEMGVFPHTLIARLTTWLIRGVVARSIEADMDAVKTSCESPKGGAGGSWADQ